MNYSTGDCIHYGAHGICRVVGTEMKELGREKKEYYLLTPISQEHIRLYLPKDADPERVKVREVLSPEEIFALVEKEKGYCEKWIHDSKLRRETYNKILRSGDTAGLMAMVRTIHAHQEELPAGKSLPMSDLELMRSGEKLLYNEFGYVLHMEKEQVLPFILGECTLEAKETVG